MMLQLTKPLLGKAELDAVERVLASGWLAEGPETEAFERRFAEYVHSRYAVAVSNCTVAITLALKACGVSGRVAVPAFTHPATALAVLHAGCTPVLYDVDGGTFNMEGCSGSLSAAVPASLFGTPLRCYPKSFIVEDAACSLGASFKGRMVGSEFTSCFSLHPRKLVTCGEGGVVTTNNEEVYEKLQRLKSFGDGGGNSRFNDVSAALANVQLGRIEYLISLRNKMAAVYDELLKNVGGLRVVPRVRGARQTFQTYTVMLDDGKDRDGIIAKLRERGVEVQFGTVALHLLPMFRRLRRGESLRNAEMLGARLLALPMQYDLTVEQQGFVVDELAEVLSN